MRLYSYQPVWVYEQLKQTGYWRPSGTKNRMEDALDTPDEVCPFILSYQWLGEFMQTKGISSLRPVQSVMDMVWAWAEEPERHPDGSSSFYSVPHVLLELEVSENRVLLSDFDVWHHPLNLWPVAPYEEVNAFMDTFDWSQRSLPEGLAILKESWPRVADLPYCAAIIQADDPTHQQSIQATLFDICLKDVVKATYLVAPVEEVNKEDNNE